MADRRSLLDEYFALEGSKIAADVDRRALLRNEYEASLPSPPLSRCPFTGEVFRHSFDPEGTDGLWWHYELPIRAVVEELPETFFAFTGAVALAGKPEPAPFRRLLGPEVPYVVPRMILHDDVRAVVSEVPIGPHVGYAIVYFAKPVPPRLKRFNDWGAGTYTYETPTQELWDFNDEDDELLDVDLARWIDSGDLLWIAPGDAELRLRNTSAGCPFVGIEGSQEFVPLEPNAAGAKPRRVTRRR